MEAEERAEVLETVARLEKRLVKLHASRNAGSRERQYEIVTLQIRIQDLRAVAAGSDDARSAALADRHKFAEQQRQLLKMAHKDRYLNILDKLDAILRAGDRLAGLAALQT